MNKKHWRPFKEAKKFVQSLKLKGQKEWREYRKSGKRPLDIPTDPHRVYKKEWTTWRDWLGKTILSYEEARKFTQALGLKNRLEWFEYCKSGKLPNDIPRNPRNAYKNKDWKGWGDWLGTETIATFERQYKSFVAARKFARSLKLKSVLEWEEYCKSGKKPKDIPSAPRNSYKKEWRDWKNWLGLREILSYDEAEKQAHILVNELGIETPDDWEKASREGKIPKIYRVNHGNIIQNATRVGGRNEV